MARDHQSRSGRDKRHPSRSHGLRQVVAGCVIFGLGVAVGAMLGPLAGPKKPVSKPKQTTARSPGSSRESPAGGKKTTGQEEKSDQLTFFQTLEETPERSKENYVPFEPTGEAQPSLETLAQKREVEMVEDAAEAAKPDVGQTAQAGVEPQEPRAKTGYYVQVATFQYKDNARRLTHELRGHGYSASTVVLESRRKPYRVKVGPYGSRREAYGVAGRLQESFLYPTSVVAEKGP